jgi:predicted acyltransferase
MATELEAAKPARLSSLDAFRGLTIAAMLLVNNAGDWGHVFPPLLHAEWHGCTATDLIFPFFLFIVGVAMTFSFGKRLALGESKKTLLLHVLRRTILLYILGDIIMISVWGAYLGHYRVVGVLQRIAFCYFFASLIVMYAGVRAQVAWTIGLLAVYYYMLKFIPLPGHAAVSLDRFANIADYIDTKLLGGTLYEWDKTLGMGHDPEGIVGTIPSISSTLAGVLCGHWLREKARSHYEKVAGMAFAGTLLVIIAALWKYDMPFNKNLWTPSYVVHTTGWALLCLGVCYWAIDIKGYRRWAKPFVVYGMNAIAAYFGASVMAYTTVWIRWKDAAGKTVMLKYYLYDHLYKSWIPYIFGDQISSAAWGISYVLLWLALMWILYKKKIFIKV